MEPPRALKVFLTVISLLVFFIIVDILTSVRYLNRMDNTHIKENIEGPLRFASPTQSVHVTGTPKSNFTLNGENKKYNTTQRPDPNTRQDDCHGCFVHNFTYLIQNKNICNISDNGTIDLLMMVLTIHANVKQRNNIRAAWVSLAHNNTGNVRYAFLLGRTADRDLMQSVSIENNDHGDILMEDFVDTYSNLTYKTIMGMKWASHFCPEARFVMKIDDDMWVNVPELLKVLNIRESALQKGVGGSCSQTARPIRDHKSKWYASIVSYPHKFFPGFCSGTGYVTSLNVARKIYEVSPNVPFFHLEDVYVALCIRRLGMKLLPIRGFYASRTRLDPCEMRSPKILTSHQVPTDFLSKVMNEKC